MDYSGRSELPYCVLKEQINIPRKKVNLFNALEGEIISSVDMIPGDRVIDWSFESGKHLFFEFFGGIPNIFYTTSNLTVVDSFKDNEAHDELHFREFPNIPYPLPSSWKSSLEEILQDNSKKSLKNALILALPHWTSLLTKEVYFRAGIETDIPVNELHENKLHALEQNIGKVYQELDKGECYLSELPKARFSLLDLQHLDIEWNHHLPVRAGYPRFIGIFYKGKSFHSSHSQLKQILGNRIEKIQRKIEKQRSELKNWKDPSIYRLYGDLLMANAYDLDRGESAVEVEDIINETGIVQIPLKSDLSIIQNAQQYYEKAKRAERSNAALEKQIDESQKELATLEQLFSKLKSVSNFSELDSLLDDLKKYGISTSQKTQSKEPPKRVPYIEFKSPDGWPVLVGRTSRDNDDLTFHIAHKDDFWFHAENVPGSHVIAVPDNKRIDKPPKATLEFAASLAAGYSQAKHSSVVPVVYTKRKYVTKPRDAGPGLVRYQYEESVIVEPRRS